MLQRPSALAHCVVVTAQAAIRRSGGGLQRQLAYRVRGTEVITSRALKTQATADVKALLTKPPQHRWLELPASRQPVPADCSAGAGTKQASAAALSLVPRADRAKESKTRTPRHVSLVGVSQIPGTCALGDFAPELHVPVWRSSPPVCGRCAPGEEKPHLSLSKPKACPFSFSLCPPFVVKKKKL